MPDTARERGLLDPFNPIQALPKAAEFLADLRSQFGNIGLAAAAYNAGPRRVREWLAGNGGMPAETLNYVLATTGRRLEDWTATGKQGKTSENEANPRAKKWWRCSNRSQIFSFPSSAIRSHSPSRNLGASKSQPDSIAIRH